MLDIKSNIKTWYTEARSFSGWRLAIGFFLAVILSVVSLFILKNAILGFFSNSIVGSGMVSEFINLFGKRRVYNIMISPWPFFLKQIFFVLLTLFYFFFFYKREKRRTFFKELDQLITDMKKYVGNPGLGCLPLYNNSQLSQLAENVNWMTKLMDELIEEERNAQKTKNDLITNVSHDLRTPLTSILGYLSLIQEDRYKDEVELRYFIDIAFDKSLNLNRLIQDLFEYTRVQNHQLAVNKAPLDIKEMLGQLTEHYRVQFEEMRFVCNESYSSSPLITEADGNLLIRVFENLISNALKYGAQKKQIDIFAFSENERIVVEVTSYGETIRTIDLPHIFERFYQADRSRGMHAESAGLGLAIAKNIVEMHEGVIDVRSRGGETVFSVYLNQSVG